jgi:uncharacterized spore protein YtfJ
MQDIKSLVDELLSRFEQLSKTETVVGKPMEVKGKTIIPLVELSIGLGSGGGGGSGEGGGTDEKGRQGQGKGAGEGAGIGGGIKITPVSVVAVDDSGVSAFSVGEKKGFMNKLADIVPQVMEKAMEKKKEKAGVKD